MRIKVFWKTTAWLSSLNANLLNGQRHCRLTLCSCNVTSRLHYSNCSKYPGHDCNHAKALGISGHNSNSVWSSCFVLVGLAFDECQGRTALHKARCVPEVGLESPKR